MTGNLEFAQSPKEIRTNTLEMGSQEVKQYRCTLKENCILKHWPVYIPLHEYLQFALSCIYF